MLHHHLYKFKVRGYDVRFWKVFFLFLRPMTSSFWLTALNAAHSFSSSCDILFYRYVGSSPKFTHFCFSYWSLQLKWFSLAASPNKRLRLSWVHNMLSTRLQLHVPCKSWEIDEDDFFFVIKHIFKIALSRLGFHISGTTLMSRWTKKTRHRHFQL